MSFLSSKKLPVVTTTAPRIKAAETDEQRAQLAAGFILHPFWHEMRNALAAMRDGTLGELRTRKETAEEDLQALEAWRAMDSATRRIEEYPYSLVESAKETQ